MEIFYAKISVLLAYCRMRLQRLFSIYLCIFCMCVYLCVPTIVYLYRVCSCCPQKTKDVGITGTGVAGGSEPRVASSLKCRAISPVLNFKVP